MTSVETMRRTAILERIAEALEQLARPRIFLGDVSFDAPQGQKATQVDPGPPSAPDSSAGGAADVAVEAPLHTTPGRRPEESERVLVETLVAMVRRAGREIPSRSLRDAFEADLASLLKAHGIDDP